MGSKVGYVPISRNNDNCRTNLFLSGSFYQYWMHRLQHAIPFLWELHSYHHRVTDLQATNTLVSHPIDFALRNVMFGLVLGIIGFNPLAIVVAWEVSSTPGSLPGRLGKARAARRACVIPVYGYSRGTSWPRSATPFAAAINA
jgi:hypothetical protein